MPKYWGKQIFTHGRFPAVGEKLKAEKEEEKRKKKEKRKKRVDNNNGQLRIANATSGGTHKQPWPNNLINILNVSSVSVRLYFTIKSLVWKGNESRKILAKILRKIIFFFNNFHF